jgi:hypothetical protein
MRSARDRAARLLRAAAALRRAARAGRRRSSMPRGSRSPRGGSWCSSKACSPPAQSGVRRFTPGPPGRGRRGPRRSRSRVARARRPTLPRVSCRRKFSSLQIARPVEAIRVEAADFVSLDEFTAGMFGDAPPRPRTGRASRSACARAWDTTPCAASPRIPIIAPSTRGGASSPANGIRTSTASRGRRPLMAFGTPRKIKEKANSTRSPDRERNRVGLVGRRRGEPRLLRRGACPTGARPDLPRNQCLVPAWFSLPEYAELHCLPISASCGALASGGAGRARGGARLPRARDHDECSLAGRCARTRRRKERASS